MDFSFSSLNNLISSNPAIAKLANNALSNLTSSPKSAPTVQVQPAVVVPQAPQGMGKGTMLAIGAAVVGVALLMVVLFKRKG